MSRLGGAVVRIAGILLSLTVQVGCSNSPTDSYDKLVQAAAVEDEEQFYEGLTEHSRVLLRRMADVADQTGGQLSLVRGPYSILPPGAVVDERIDGNLAILTVDDGRAQDRVAMVQEDGDWRLELIELESFWARLR